MNISDHKYLHALNTISGIGAQKIRLLLSYFETIEVAWHSSSEDLIESGLSEKLAHAITQAAGELDVDNLYHNLQKENVSLLIETDEAFPQNLKKIDTFPALLYTRGNINILNQPSVAIVGSRKFSPYGEQAAARLAHDLAAAGVHVVSGLALGIDAIAHRGALDAHATGKTIGVLGGGIDDHSIAPRTNVTLAHAIIDDGGVLLSSHAPGTTPSKGTFPARNAIMAGMSDAVIVIEATRDSGTLITAQLAEDFSTPLFAVPGSIFAQSSVGTNDLINSGKAKIIQSADDVLKTLHITATETMPTSTYKPETPGETEIYDLLKQHSEGLSIDKIIRHTTLEGTVVSSTLVMMEMSDAIADLGGGIYVTK